MRNLMGAVPKNIQIDDIKKEILNLDFVKEINDFHVWLEGTHSVMASCHLVVTKNHSLSLIKTIFSVHGITHSTVQFESHHNHHLKE